MTNVFARKARANPSEYSLTSHRTATVLVVLTGVTLAAHLLTATHYPMFRDEFYYLECANHLDWGYVDQPPLSIAALAGWKNLFGDSLFAVRFVPALAAMFSVALTWKMARELGGGVFAAALAGMAVFIAPQQRGMTGFFSMNAFDLLFWLAAFLMLIRIIKRDTARCWIPFGVMVGLGLMNKISLLYFGAGLVIGLALTPMRKHFAKKEFWIGGAIALLLFLPYVLWQFSHEFATLEFVRNATAHKNVAFAPHQFLAEFALENNPLTAVMWLGGFAALFAWKSLKPYRLLGWIAAVVFLILMTQNGNPYYAAGLFPMLIAAGAVWIETVLATPKWTWVRAAYVALLIAGGAALLPFGLRILSPGDFVRYQAAIGIAPKPAERGHMDEIWPQHFSDSFGWTELTTATADAFHSLTPKEQKGAVIIARNYGQEGAINYYGRAYGLPLAYSTNNNCYFWGPPKVTPNMVYLVILRRENDPRDVFDSVAVNDVPDNPWAMPYERNNAIFICRGLKYPVGQLWASRKDFD
jgi:hypothetical protein